MRNDKNQMPDSLMWPKPDSEADRLLARMLDRASPGWTLRMAEANAYPAEVIDHLWAWNPLFQHVANTRYQRKDVAKADRAIERLGAGEHAVFSTIEAGALSVLKARHSLALAAATARIVTGDRDAILRLPHGLSVDDRRIATTVRLLYRADTA